MTGSIGAVGQARYEIQAGPGIVRTKIDGSVSIPDGLFYPFNPATQAVSSTELTVSGPPGYVNVSLNVHVDGVLDTPVCTGSNPNCGGIGVFVRAGIFAVTAEFNTVGGTRANDLGLAFDPIPGGYHVHGDVTLPEFGVPTNTPEPIPLTVNVSARFGASATFDSTFDDPGARYQVSFPTSGPVLNVPPGYTVSGPNVVDNHWTDPFAPPSGDVVVDDCSDPALANLESVAGNLVFRNIPGCPEISVPQLKEIHGDLIVEGNTGLGHVAFTGPVIVDGSVRIVNNSGTDMTIGLGDTSTGGDLDISGNTGATVIDAGRGQIGGSATIADNGDAVVNLSDVTDISGSLDLEALGDVAGTTADGSTDVTLLGGTAALHALLPEGAFDHPVDFTITRHTDPPEDGQAADGSDAVIDPIFGYEFAFDVPTLNADAQLTFTLDMSQLDAADQAQVLNSLASGLATIVGKGDDPGAEYRAFPVCAGAQTPAADGCVAITTLDAAGNPTTGQPAFVRFDGVVGHFSSYAVATVEPKPRDTTAPVVTVPADSAVDATSPAGAKASYSASARDDVDPSPTLACSPPSGSVLPIGTTTVTCTATDASGNSGSASFKIRVRSAGEQIANLTDKTLAYLDLPALRPALKAALQAVADAIAARHPKAACVALDLYVMAVKLAPARAFTAAEKADLIADAARIKAVIGC
jgi:hypothetical protein